MTGSTAPSRRRLATAFLAGAAAAAGLVAGAGLVARPGPDGAQATGSIAPPPAAQALATAPTVTSAVAERRSVPVAVAASGSLAARREASVGAEIGGLRVAEVLADLDDRVEAGQVLVRFDTDLLRHQLALNEANAVKAEAAVEQAEAGVPEAEANLRVAQADYERSEALRGTGAASAQVLDQRRGALDQARARLAAARAAVTVSRAERASVQAQGAEIRARIAKAEVRAPVAGIVSRRAVEPGNVVPQGGSEPLFRIIEDGIVELAAEVPDVDLPRLREGQPARVTLADGSVVEGRVRLVAPVVEGRSRLGTVFVGLQADRALRPGAYARASITVDTLQAVSIPTSAVEVRDGLPTALVVGEDGRTQRRNLQLGAGAGGWAVVTAGVAAGERVILGGAAFVRDGAPVRTVSLQP